MKENTTFVLPVGLRLRNPGLIETFQIVIFSVVECEELFTFTLDRSAELQCLRLQLNHMG